MLKERDIENLLDEILKDKKWILDFSNKKKNVFHQRPKTQEEKKKLNGLEPDYCLYLTEDSSYPEIIIETKKPGMKIKETKSQAENYAKILGSKIIILFDGIQTKSYWVENSKNLIFNELDVNEIMESSFYDKFIVNNTNEVNENKLIIKSKQDLIEVFKFANKKLQKAGITKGMERFFEFSNLLFLKLISEDNDIIKETIPSHIKWETYKNKQGSELLIYINDVVIPELERTFNKQSQDTLFSKLIITDVVTLKEIIDKLDKLELKDIETDIKGDAFEYFIQQYNNSSNDLGEYFTPRHIVNFIVSLANPVYGEKVYDPFCGTGGMLISSFNKIKSNLISNGYLTESTLNDLRENTIYGSELSSNAKITKMNMILTGDGHSNIKQQNTLSNPVKGEYDIVITNIPFNLEGIEQTSYYNLLSKEGNIQAIQHIIDSLNNKPSARAYVIVPEGMLNNSNQKILRKYLIENNYIKEIISLPSGVFLPYTEAKASILVLKGKNSKALNCIKFAKIKNDGFTLTQRRRKINDTISDLEEYLSGSLDYNEVSYTDIVNNKDYSLIGFKYFDDMPEDYIKLGEVLSEVKEKNTELYPVATVTKKDFYGLLMGADYWGKNFLSVTSDSNEDYRVVSYQMITYNPSRANVGSIGINIEKQPVSVSKAYPTLKVTNDSFLPEYVFLYLRSSEGNQYIIERSFGSVRQSLSTEDLFGIGIPNISIEEQKKVVKKAKNKYKNYKKTIEELNSYDVINELI